MPAIAGALVLAPTAAVATLAYLPVGDGEGVLWLIVAPAGTGILVPVLLARYLGLGWTGTILTAIVAAASASAATTALLLSAG